MARNYGLQHSPSTHSLNISSHSRQFDICVLKHLLQSIGGPGSVSDKRCSVASQITQFSYGCRWNEAGLQQSQLETFGQPFRVEHVGLPTRHTFQMLSIKHYNLQMTLQDVVNRFPVDTGTFHRNVSTSGLPEPIKQIK